MLPPEWKDGRFDTLCKGCVIIITSMSFYHMFVYPVEACLACAGWSASHRAPHQQSPPQRRGARKARLYGSTRATFAIRSLKRYLFHASKQRKKGYLIQQRGIDEAGLWWQHVLANIP